MDQGWRLHGQLVRRGITSNGVWDICFDTFAEDGGGFRKDRVIVRIQTRIEVPRIQLGGFANENKKKKKKKKRVFGKLL
jgi:hypothetical protein